MTRSALSLALSAGLLVQQAVAGPMSPFQRESLILQERAAEADNNSSVENTGTFSKLVVTVDRAADAVQSWPVDRAFNQPYVPNSVGQAASARGLNATTTPHFQIYNQELAQSIIGQDAQILRLVHQEGYAFAHEAVSYYPKEDQLLFCSNAGGKNGRSNLTANNEIFYMKNISEIAERALKNESSFDADVHALGLNSSIVQMTNGGAPYGADHFLTVNQGRGEEWGGTLALISLASIAQGKPAAAALLTNAFGKQFVSPNDVSVHPTTGQLFFTDSQYGVTQRFRPTAAMPLSTWLFDPRSGALKVVDDTVRVPNGVAISPDGKTAYITDTSPIGFDAPPVGGQNRSATIKAFDVETYSIGGSSSQSHRLTNPRTFAWPMTNIADGVKCDAAGNVYAGVGDGVEIYAAVTGDLIAKIYLPEGGGVNLAFAGPGRLAVSAEDKVWLVSGLKIDGPDLTLLPPPGKGIDAAKLFQSSSNSSSA